MFSSSSLRFDFDPERRVLRVAGDIDHAATDRFEAELLTRAGDGDLVVDLTDATFFPSRAAGVAARAQQVAREAGTHMTFTAEPSSIAGRVLYFLQMLDPDDRARRPEELADEPGGLP